MKSEINDLQFTIMVFVCEWAKQKRSPIPKTKILDTLEKKGRKNFDILNALNVLIKKGYIRRAFSISNKAYYVQLRTIQL